MMALNRRSLFRPDPRQSGKVKFLTILLFIGLIAGGYFLYVWGPLEIDNFDVAKDCDKALNKTWRFKDTDHPRMMFLDYVHAHGSHPVNEDGEVVQVPNINPSDDDVQVQIDHSVDPPVLSIDARYSRTVKLPLFKGKTHTFWFSTHCEQTIQAVKWN